MTPFDCSSEIDQLKTLLAQAFLFRRPNSDKASIAIRQFMSVAQEYGSGWEGKISLGFGSGSEFNPEYKSFSITRTNNIGELVGDAQMVVSIMHELLHFADLMNPPRGFDIFDRHNEIYRLQNQTLFDLGLPLDPGPNGVTIKDNDKYTGSKY